MASRIPRVRRKRQRLPPSLLIETSLLIENASDRDLHSAPKVCSEAFPIKASDNSLGIWELLQRRFPPNAKALPQLSRVDVIPCGKLVVAECADCGAAICSNCRLECCGGSFCGYCYDYYAAHSCVKKPAKTSATCLQVSAVTSNNAGANQRIESGT